MYLLNDTICTLNQKFMIYHQKSMPYHPHANATMEAFNNILEYVLTKVCNVQCDDWD
jgi:hypothetical protein